MDDLTITGLEEIQSALSELPDRLAQSALRAGMRQAANIIRDQARANFDTADGPSDLTGALRASIRTTQKRGSPDRIVFCVVAGTLTAAQTRKFGSDSAFYALWVEKGHINRAMHDALHGSREFKAHQRSISESNTPAHPYMRPAVEQKAQAALDTLAETVAAQLGVELT